MEYDEIRVSLVDKNDREIVGLTIAINYDEDTLEAKFINPMTNEQVDTARACLIGWSEQEEKYNEAWEELVDDIENDEWLEAYIGDGINREYQSRNLQISLTDEH